MSFSSRLKVILGTGDFNRRGFTDEGAVSARCSVYKPKLALCAVLQGSELVLVVWRQRN